MKTLTNVRTHVVFTQYQEVKTIQFVGNKIMAMNTIRSAFGVKEFTVLREYKTEGYLPEGSYYTNA